MRGGPSISAAILVVGLVAVAPPSMAQTRIATGTIRVEQALTLSNVQSMRFMAARRNIQSAASIAIEQTTGASSSPAVIDITGDPGRVYRVQIPDAITAEIADGVIDGFQVWSETMGDVSTTMTGRLNSEGHDRLSISGVLTTTAGAFVTNVSTSVPVGIDYE